MERQLFRSRTRKIFGGVCGGLGEYLEIDPILVRIIAIVLTMAHGIGVLAYIIAWIVIPQRPEDFVTVDGSGEVPPPSWKRYLPGLLLMFIGAILLIRENIWWFDWHEIWPLVLIGAGLFMIFRRNYRKSEQVEQTPDADYANGVNGANGTNGGSAS